MRLCPISPRNAHNNTTTTVLRPSYRSTCISRHLQLRTGEFWTRKTSHKASSKLNLQLRRACWAVKDTEALIAEGQVPQVDAKVVGRDERLLVAVDGQWVDMVGVCIGVDAPRAGLHHGVGRHKRRHEETGYRRRVSLQPGVVFQVEALRSLGPLTQLPQLHCLVWIPRQHTTAVARSG